MFSRHLNIPARAGRLGRAVTLSKDVRYGPAPRNALDIYVPPQQPSLHQSPGTGTTFDTAEQPGHTQKTPEKIQGHNGSAIGTGGLSYARPVLHVWKQDLEA